MSYKTIDGLSDGAVSTVEEYTEAVNKLRSVFDADTIECPQCGGSMYYVDSSDFEEYKADGTFEESLRFYCDCCSTFADVTQVYAPVARKVKVQHDVFED